MTGETQPNLRSLTVPPRARSRMVPGGALPHRDRPDAVLADRAPEGDHGGGSGFFNSPNTNVVATSVRPQERGMAAGVSVVVALVSALQPAHSPRAAAQAAPRPA